MKRIAVLGIVTAIVLSYAGEMLFAEKASEPAALVQGNNAFALDMYGRLGRQPGNLFLSPYSISTAMAMVYGGAGGETAGQIAKGMHFATGQEQLHPAFAALQAALTAQASKTAKGDEASIQLSVANRLWGDKGQRFLDTYLKLTQQYYGASAQLLDFAGAPEPSREAINRWVQGQTKGKIVDLLPVGTVNSGTRLVLTNAIYFLGNWANQFPKQATKDGVFSTSANRQAKVPMMHQIARFRLGAAEAAQFLELPYKGGRLSMVILLPDSLDGLAKLEQSLSSSKLDAWLGTLQERDVSVFLPRFKIATQLALNETLESLGMTLPFSDGADFSGMDGRKDLFISAVVHKAVVEVDEQGTEAAAATAAVMAWKAVTPPPVEFRADHPFLFLIRDNPTGSILFLGRVIDPRQQETVEGKSRAE